MGSLPGVNEYDFKAARKRIMDLTMLYRSAKWQNLKATCEALKAEIEEIEKEIHEAIKKISRPGRQLTA